MEFIENNYVWIIVIAVIVVMTIIGYFADKMDNGEKPAKEKKEKKVKKNNDLKEPVPEVEDNTEMDDSFAAEWDENPKPVKTDDVINIEGTADTTNWNNLPEYGTENLENNELENIVPLEPNIGEENNDENMIESSEKANEDSNYDIDWATEVIDNPNEEKEEPIFTSSINTPEESTEQPEENIEQEDNEKSDEAESQPIEEDLNTNNAEELLASTDDDQSGIEEQPKELDDLEFELPNIETLNEQIKEVDDDEDVWKF